MENFNFTVEPQGRPDAGKLITSFTYDAFKRQIRILMGEDTELNAHRWIVSIKDLYNQANVHSALKAKDQIVLTLFSGDTKVDTIRFGRLMLEEHSCCLQNNSLCHGLTIGFEKMEIDS